MHPSQLLGDQSYRGAWPEETAHGIGWRSTAFTFDRRHASVMRSRAFDRMTPGHMTIRPSCSIERRYGLPLGERHYTGQGHVHAAPEYV